MEIKNKVSRSFSKWSECLLDEFVSGIEDEFRDGVADGEDAFDVIEAIVEATENTMFEYAVSAWLSANEDDLKEEFDLTDEDFEEWE
jgi:hypothetical protein